MESLSEKKFKNKISKAKKPVVVMVKTNSCPNCKALAPVFEQAAKEAGPQADFNYLVVDDKRDLARELKIMGVPTLLYYKHGVLQAKKIGSQSLASINKQVAAIAGLSLEEAQANEYKSFLSRLFGKKN